MSTVNSSTQAQSTNSGMYNPYLALSQTSMSNDFFGAQAFGKSLYNTQTTATVQQPVAVQQPAQAQAPQGAQPVLGSGTLASAIFQQYLMSQNGIQTPPQAPQTQTVTDTQSNVSVTPGKTAPTMQDYYMASQIANAFAGSTPIIYNPSGFVQNDVFAQQYFNPTAKQGVNYVA